MLRSLGKTSTILYSRTGSARFPYTHDSTFSAKAVVTSPPMATALFPVGAPDVLYLVDLSSYVLRAYHAIAPLSSPTGEPTHAVHGTVSMLERLVRQCRPA